MRHDRHGAILRALALSGVLVVAAAISAGTASATGAIPDADICVVDGADVSYASYKQVLHQARRNYHTQGQTFPAPSTDGYARLREQAADYLVEQSLFRADAARRGIAITEAAVQQRLAQLKSSFFKGSEAAYEQELHKQGLTEQQVIENIREQLLSEALFDAVTKSTTATDAQALRYYRENPSQYRQPASRTVAHILVKHRRLAWHIYHATLGRSLHTFGRYAKRYSKDPSSADTGGQLPVSKGQTVPEFDKVAFHLRTGEQSKPVHTQFGWHVIRAVSKVHPATQQRFREVRAQIIQQLTQEQRSFQMQNYRTALRKSAVVTCSPPVTWHAVDARKSAIAFQAQRYGMSRPAGDA